MERDELAAWLRLCETDGVGRATARQLLAAFGLPQAIFEAPHSALTQFIPEARTRAFRDAPIGLEKKIDITLEWLASAPAGSVRRILTLADPDYPQALLQSDDPPLLLYVAGQPLAGLRKAVAVVGSRNPTPQGRDNARRFAHSFACADVTVVSGLALGVDAAAHEGALDGAAAGQLATVAVVGTGLDRVYPRENLQLARRIAERGLLVSEFHLGTPPLAHHFPSRNRIISGLSQGTLVVEAAVRSGSLITARCALEQGREVFAIPGSIHAPQARGCHALIRQGAKLVESAQDVLEDLRWEAPSTVCDVRHHSAGSEGEDALLQAMGFDAVSLDALVARSGLPTADLQSRLLELELDGCVARMPGGLFQRIAAS